MADAALASATDVEIGVQSPIRSPVQQARAAVDQATQAVQRYYEGFVHVVPLLAAVAALSFEAVGTTAVAAPAMIWYIRGRAGGLSPVGYVIVYIVPVALVVNVFTITIHNASRGHAYQRLREHGMLLQLEDRESSRFILMLTAFVLILFVLAAGSVPFQALMLAEGDGDPLEAVAQLLSVLALAGLLGLRVYEALRDNTIVLLDSENVVALRSKKQLQGFAKSLASLDVVDEAKLAPWLWYVILLRQEAIARRRYSWLIPLAPEMDEATLPVLDFSRCVGQCKARTPEDLIEELHRELVFTAIRPRWRLEMIVKSRTPGWSLRTRGFDSMWETVYVLPGAMADPVDQQFGLKMRRLKFFFDRLFWCLFMTAFVWYVVRGFGADSSEPDDAALEPAFGTEPYEY
jgi:hypothetical protein